VEVQPPSDSGTPGKPGTNPLRRTWVKPPEDTFCVPTKVFGDPLNYTVWTPFPSEGPLKDSLNILWFGVTLSSERLSGARIENADVNVCGADVDVIMIYHDDCGNTWETSTHYHYAPFGGYPVKFTEKPITDDDPRPGGVNGSNDSGPGTVTSSGGYKSVTFRNVAEWVGNSRRRDNQIEDPTNEGYPDVPPIRGVTSIAQIEREFPNGCRIEAIGEIEYGWKYYGPIGYVFMERKYKVQQVKVYYN